MEYSYTETFKFKNKKFLFDHMMGPNVMRISEELSSYLPIDNKTKILDLGCGTGLSSIFLAEKYGSTVIAADLWISPTDNSCRFHQFGLERQILPISLDATKGLPFAQDYFDIIFSVDVYHYFGTTQEMLPSLLPFVKKGGYIAVAVPGLQQEFLNGVPEELKPLLPENANFHDLAWWKALWIQTEGIELTDCREMDSHNLAWEEWLQTTNPYAINDVKMMEVENGKYYNFIQLIANRK